MLELRFAICLCCLLVGVRTISAQTDAGSCSAPGVSATSLQLKIDRDKAAIQSLGFGQRSADIEGWALLAGDARKKFMRDTFDMLLASANASVAAGGSLSPPSANTAISELRAAHIDFGPLNDAIRRLAATPGKPARAKEIIDFLDALQRAKDSPGVARTIVEGKDSQAVLEVLSKVLGWAKIDPKLSLLAADLQFTTSSIYNNVARRVSRDQVDKLTTLNEKDLQNLKRLSIQLTTDVRSRNALIACSARSETPAKSCLCEKVVQPIPGLYGYGTKMMVPCPCM